MMTYEKVLIVKRTIDPDSIFQVFEKHEQFGSNGSLFFDRRSCHGIELRPSDNEVQLLYSVLRSLAKLNFYYKFKCQSLMTSNFSIHSFVSAVIVTAMLLDLDRLYESSLYDVKIFKSL